jgi:hypothetical protein
MPELAEWDSFYVIVGSAAGALIGLQFVVITLIAERPPPRAGEANAAFATPTIVHFGAVLFLSAIVRVPWQSIVPVAIVWGLLGIAGAIYVYVVARRMQIQQVYRPQFEDWLFHAVLPWAAYVVLALTAIAALFSQRLASFGVGFAALVLLFTGIHNAWDAVTYHVLINRPKSETDRTPDDRSEIEEKTPDRQ